MNRSTTEHFRMIQAVTGLTDDDVLCWARQIESERNATFKNNIPQELIDEVKQNDAIMECLKGRQKVAAVQMLRKSGITDMTLRENIMIIETVMETLT